MRSAETRRGSLHRRLNDEGEDVDAFAMEEEGQASAGTNTQATDVTPVHETDVTKAPKTCSTNDKDLPCSYAMAKALCWALVHERQKRPHDDSTEDTDGLKSDERALKKPKTDDTDVKLDIMPPFTEDDQAVHTALEKLYHDLNGLIENVVGEFQQNYGGVEALRWEMGRTASGISALNRHLYEDPDASSTEQRYVKLGTLLNEVLVFQRGVQVHLHGLCEPKPRF